MKLDVKKFKECNDGGKFKSKIANDVQAAVDFGVGDIPAFFVGNEYISGAVALEQFKEAVHLKERNNKNTKILLKASHIQSCGASCYNVVISTD